MLAITLSSPPIVQSSRREATYLVPPGAQPRSFELRMHFADSNIFRLTRVLEVVHKVTWQTRVRLRQVAFKVLVAGHAIAPRYLC